MPPPPSFSMTRECEIVCPTNCEDVSIGGNLRTQRHKGQSSAAQQKLLQLRVLGFGLLQDGDVGVGVFPEGEEVFVSSQCPDAGGVGVRSLRGSRLQGIGKIM